MITVLSQNPRFRQWLWLLPACIGGLTTIMIMLVLPPDRTINGFSEFFFKLTPLLSAVLTIAFFPKERSWLQWSLLLGFVLYMGYLDSAFIVQVMDFANTMTLSTEVQMAQFSHFYRFALFVNAFTILFALLAFRLGGGSTVRTLKIGLAGILILISGLNDLTFWAMYSWPGGERPATFDWASHVIIFTGEGPTLTTMLLFIGMHGVLIVGVMLLPIQRWIDQTIQRSPQPAQLQHDSHEAA